MGLDAELTIGWQNNSEDKSSKGERFPAKAIHEKCSGSGGETYKEKLKQELLALRSKLSKELPLKFQSTEQLFRRRAGAFSDIKRFVGGLSELVVSNPSLGVVRCEIDVFAYAFLKSAKNFDFFLPENQEKTGLFRDTYPKLQKELAALESFERQGKIITAIDTKAYLDLRRIVSRKSARDERRTLATLLVSGPSTKKEIKDDLGLPYGLSERILPTFKNIGVVKSEVVDSENNRYVIREEALPRVIFCLREKNGIDLLETLG